jgi:two-component system, NtrC family, nitrogen regulation response regulator GlnG
VFFAKHPTMVYLIDDDKSVRRGFELFLKSAGMGYKSFESADLFSSSVEPQVNDTIILDLNLPGTSGCEFLQILRSKKNDVPVIVVTAFDEPQSRKLCKELGVKAFLRKPVDGEVLIDIILK